MVYESIVEKLFDEENDDIIELVQDGGQVVKFEQIAVVIYNTEYYAILRPLELKENEVVIFKLIEDDEDSLDLVVDEELSKKILEVYTRDVNEIDE
ncbi:MAG: DUF1292 domain-containing protein [Clostridia bacterium]|nr:DUF1292 domain-containing protein [Clostridia bacterium]